MAIVFTRDELEAAFEEANRQNNAESERSPRPSGSSRTEDNFRLQLIPGSTGQLQPQHASRAPSGTGQPRTRQTEPRSTENLEDDFDEGDEANNSDSDEDLGDDEESEQPSEVESEFSTKRRKRDEDKKRKRQPLRLETNMKSRTRKCNEYVLALNKKAEKFRVTCNAKVFLKWQYQKGDKSFIQGSYGQFFHLPGEEQMSTSDIDAFAAAAKIQMVSALQQREETLPRAPTGTANAPFSPGKRNDTAAAEHICDYCHDGVKYVAGKRIETPWLGCEGDERETVCRYGWIHASCAGFPVTTEDEVARLPKYFCPKHRDYGALKSMEAAQLMQPPPEPPAGPSTQTRRRKTKKPAGL